MRNKIHIKFTILVIILCSFLLPVQATNNAHELEKTIESFVQALQEDTITNVPQEFKLSLDDLRQVVALTSENGISEEKLQKYFADHTESTEQKFDKVLKLLNHPSEFVSFDTLTYTSENISQITVALVFKTRDYRSNKKTTIRVLFNFLIVQNKLKLARNLMQKKDDFDYSKYVSRTVQSHRGYELRHVYKNVWFANSNQEVVPFKKADKWGLKKLDGTIFFKAEYDSIYAFYKNYALVVKDGMYNLLNENLEFEFAKFQNRIERRSGKYSFDFDYYVQQKDGTFRKYPYPQISNNDEISEVEVMEDDYQAQYSTNKEKKLTYSKQLAEHNPDLFDVKISSYGKQLEFNRFFIVEKSTKDTITHFDNYEYVGTPDEFIYIYNNGITILIDKNLDTLFLSEFVCLYESPGYIDVFDSSTRLFGMFCPFTNVYIQPKYQYIKAVDRDRFFVVVTTDGKFGYLDSKGNELFD